jgi:hypothetical protein
MQAGGARDDNASQLAMPTPDMGPGMVDGQGVNAMVSIQQMRHNEGLVRSLVDLASSARERDQEIISKLQLQNDKMSNRQLDMIDLVEGMLTRKQERELTQAAYEEDKERKDKTLGVIMKYVMPAFAKEAGIEMPGDAAATIKDIFLRLPVETQNKIIADLPEIDGNKLLALMEGADTEATH